jgi:hypothetical protein
VLVLEKSLIVFLKYYEGEAFIIVLPVGSFV